jgi:tripartite-type tricarboxylate transporter receptor subunit TctC
VQRAAPDGHTLMVTSTGDSMGLAGHRGERPVAVRDELPPISLSPRRPMSSPRIRAFGRRDVAGPIALARQRPGQLSFGSSGTGAASHLAAEPFASMAESGLPHLPDRGTGPALNDLVGGGILLLVAPR